MTLATDSALPCSSKRSAASPATRAVRQGPPAECKYVVEHHLGAVCVKELPYSSRVLQRPLQQALCAVAPARNKHAMLNIPRFGTNTCSSTAVQLMAPQATTNTDCADWQRTIATGSSRERGVVP